MLKKVKKLISNIKIPKRKSYPKINVIVPDANKTKYMETFFGDMGMDLLELGAFALNKREKKSTAKDRVLHIEFVEDKIKIVSGNGTEEHLYTDIEDIKICNFPNKYLRTYEYTVPSVISFNINSEPHNYFFEYGSLIVCKFLYENKIPIKEFYKDERVFLGKKQSAVQIQKLKKEYGIVW